MRSTPVRHQAHGNVETDLEMDVEPDLGSSVEGDDADHEESHSGPLKAALQDDIALRHLELAESVARSFGTSGPEASDIRQVAYLGLIKAVKRFNPSRGVAFASFAVPTITGEIKRYLRDSCWVVRPPRDVQDLRTEIARTAPAMAQRLGRDATARELAVELGWPEQKILEAQASHTSLRPDSLDVPFEGRTWADTLPTEADGTDRSDDMISLRGAVNDLSASEKELLYRRYFMEQTQQGIGDELGMSQMQVSRTLARILVKLQKRLLGAPATTSTTATTGTIGTSADTTAVTPPSRMARTRSA